MRLDGRNLTPAPIGRAGKENYTWDKAGNWVKQAFNVGYQGEWPGYIFESKDDFAEQIKADYPHGIPCEVKGYPTGWGDGCVIGDPGFGWYGQPPKRFPHIGHIQFGERVEIGSNVTIDRGSIEDTIIGNDVKIDNGVHIGHNAIIGDESILTAHCVIGGSARIGRRVWVGLGALIKNQVRVGNDAVIGMGAVVVKDVPTGITVVGNPAEELK